MIWFGCVIWCGRTWGLGGTCYIIVYYAMSYHIRMLYYISKYIYHMYIYISISISICIYMYVHMYVYYIWICFKQNGKYPQHLGVVWATGPELILVLDNNGFNYRRTGRNKLEDKSHLDLDPNQLGSSKNNWWFHSQHCQNPGFSVRKFAFTQLAWTCTSPKKAGLHWLGVSHIPQKINLVQSCIWHDSSLKAWLSLHQFKS